MKKILFLLIILLIVSCKLLSPDDTTPPEIQLNIAGGNEISRGVTLYLDIEDDSKIDYVSVIIDDTTAITVESNFDTISFDVTPFADENEHILYVEVADKEGNIGESAKLNVIITEFPGWRMYIQLNDDIWGTSLKIDSNDRIWIGTTDGLFIFDITKEINSEVTPQNGDISGYIEDIELISDSRAWVAYYGEIAEYHFDLNKIIKSFEVPDPNPDYISGGGYLPSIYSLAVDADYDLWIGGYYALVHYNHVDFDIIYSHSDPYIHRPFEMIVDKNNILYVCDDNYFYRVKNSVIEALGAAFEHSGRTFIIDSLGNIWAEGLDKFDGTNWTIYSTPNPGDHAIPLHADKNGNIFTNVFAYTDAYGTKDHGLATFKNNHWDFWSKYDSPFIYLKDFNKYYLDCSSCLKESSNGDLWMILDNSLWRYRPSLGGYP